MEQQSQQPIQEKTESKPPIKTNWKYLAIVMAFALLAVGGILLLRTMEPVPSPAPVVQQTPPREPQPQVLDTSGWQTYRSDDLAFEIKYPGGLDTEYIQLQAFNPESIEVSNQSGEFSCADTEVTVNGRVYCVTRTGDAGAGSVYYDYTYKTILDGKLVRMRFTLRYPNCGGFFGVETKEAECKAEEETFSSDVFADQILSTFRFIP